MTEFARFLLSAGISRKRFSRIVELSYLEAASLEARFQNNRVNQSAVAAMTGLTRTQVRRLLRRDRGRAELPSDRIDRVVNAWTTDAEYITSTLAPRRLRLSGQTPSFQSLVQRAGGDIPARSVLRELVRQNLVVVGRSFVSLRQSVQRDRDVRSLKQLSIALARTIATSGNMNQLGSLLRPITMEVAYPAHSGIGRILMQRRVSRILKSFLADIESAGAAVALESPVRAGAVPAAVSRIKLMLLTHDDSPDPLSRSPSSRGT